MGLVGREVSLHRDCNRALSALRLVNWLDSWILFIKGETRTVSAEGMDLRLNAVTYRI